jgi:cysteine desulfurase/selenocysteine lyase
MSPDACRRGIPALAADPELVYLDSAASCLLHEDVLRVVVAALQAGGSAGRGAHRLGRQATALLEGAREAVAAHLDSAPEQVVFVKSATEGLHLFARGWGGTVLRPGDTVLVTALDHHASLLPWRELARELGLRVGVVDCDDRGELDLGSLERQLGPRVRVLALPHVSNVSGARVPLAEVVARVRAGTRDCAVVVDGSQAVAHGPVAPEKLGVDAYVFSGHKAHGPLGAGVVWASARRWAEARPVLWGGGMVQWVGPQSEELVDLPWRYEAGTPNHPAVAGLAAGLRFCRPHEPLAVAAAERIAALPGCRLLGRPRDRVGVVSFVVDGVHAHDVGALLDEAGICVRVGHLCAQPYLARLGAPAAVRASFASYSTLADVDRLVDGLASVRARLGRVG